MEASASDEFAMLIPTTVSSAPKRPLCSAASVTTAIEAPGLITSAAATIKNALKFESNIIGRALPEVRQGSELSGVPADSF